MSIADLIYIDATGYNYPDYPTVLTFVKGIYQGIYGDDIYLGNDSQDGQLTAAIAQAIFDTAQVGAATYASFAPSTSVGTGLSRLVKINGMNRRIATNSTVELVIIGQNLTLLQNCIAVDNLQQQWSIPLTTIPSSGTITVTATAVNQGAVSALPNTITTIFTPTNGWQSVNNPNAATVGVAIETDAALRQRQAQSTSISAQTVFDATISNVANVTGLIKVQGYENDTAAPDSNGLPAHSIAVVASGGLDTDIAQAIQLKKTPGTQTYGTTHVSVLDSRGVPLVINFFRPIQAEIGVRVTISPFSNYVSTTAALIQAALAAYIVNNTVIGGSVVITQLYSLAYLISGGVQNPAGLTYNIVSIQLQKNAGGFSGSNVDLLFDEIAVCDPSADISVVT